MLHLRRDRADETVFRITAARRGLAEDVGARQRRYVISMLIRSVSVVLTVLLWNVSVPLATVTLAAGVLIPYVAVVVANAGRENAPILPRTALVGDGSRDLPAGGRALEGVVVEPEDRPAGEAAPTGTAPDGGRGDSGRAGNHSESGPADGTAPDGGRPGDGPTGRADGARRSATTGHTGPGG
ncbi:DUF3099 domain-containing protein [Streptomyces sp. ST2-7A]|uniref:DUF3099 domain-containing protein n=1 Tax=Streptomyces sp. ST2-7A TaxID=2907214 RepID=UPI001F3D15DE|nr:DUF3099 domain-containing protein [Streptomyces sp. ST2-7A]